MSRNHRIALLIMGLGVLLCACLCGGLFAIVRFSEEQVELSDVDRELLVYPEEIAIYLEEPLDLNPALLTSTKSKRGDISSASVTYEWESADDFTFIDSVLDWDPSPGGDRADFAFAWQATALGARSADVKLEEAQDVYACCEMSRFGYFVNTSGARVGTLFMARQGGLTFTLTMFGVVIDDPEILGELLDARMARMAEVGSGSSKLKPRPPFSEARRDFISTLSPAAQQGEDSEQPLPPSAPPEEVPLRLVTYPAPLGDMHAYLSPDPKDGQRHPLVIWKLGGFSNGIGMTTWFSGSPENDQSATQFRQHGILTMYPSLRGAHDNPGRFEGFYGEVDDLRAAITHARTLDYVDPERIYLAGHSTGGTLALLTAPLLSPGEVRAVFALGPIASVADYGQDGLPFSVEDRTESLMRSPVAWLKDIAVPTYLFEGEGGNSAALMKMKRLSTNPLVQAELIPDHDHFSLIAPLNDVLAEAILADTPDRAAFDIDSAQIEALGRAPETP